MFSTDPRPAGMPATASEGPIACPMTGRVIARRIACPTTGRVIARRIACPTTGRVIARRIACPTTGRTAARWISVSTTGRAPARPAVWPRLFKSASLLTTSLMLVLGLNACGTPISAALTPSAPRPAAERPYPLARGVQGVVSTGGPIVSATGIAGDPAAGVAVDAATGSVMDAPMHEVGLLADAE